MPSLNTHGVVDSHGEISTTCSISVGEELSKRGHKAPVPLPSNKPSSGKLYKI